MNYEQNLFIDLHIHTTFSDGTFSPEQAVKYAQAAGITAIGITDHDNVDGIPPAIKEGSKRGVEVIPGVELSAEFEENHQSHEIHILGYFINWENIEFQERVRSFREVRKQRAFRIMKKLEHLGINVDKEKLSRITGTGSIGRLHFARALVEDGFVKNIPEAFQKYLGSGKPAYEPKFRLKPEEAVKMIITAKGIPVLAHPYYGSYDSRSLIERLKNAGMGGIEAWHSKHPKNVVDDFLKLAREFDLLITGGSDCHGSTNEGTSSMGSQKIPYSILWELKKYKHKIDSVE